MIAECSRVPAGCCWMIYYTEVSLESSGLVSIICMNIKIRSFAYRYKDDIFNLHSGLSMYCNSSTNIILVSCLAGFNYYLTGNISSST